MKKEVRVLILEDDPGDVFRLTMELRHGGIQFQSQHVYSRDAFRKALDKEIPDVILSDQGLPSFDGFTALQIAQEKCPRVPFIVVSGSYNQETAVEMLMNGAADYVCKGHLADLVPAVTQALAEAEKQTLAVADPPAAEQTGETPARAANSPLPQTERSHSSGTALFLCPKCRQLTDEHGSLQNLTDYLAAHDRAQISSAVCPGCSYQFP